MATESTSNKQKAIWTPCRQCACGCDKLVVLLQFVRKPMWWIVMFLIPFVNFIFVILLYIELAKAFGKGGGFAAGLIFLSIIFFPILGFGSSQYVLGSAAAPNPAS